MALFFFLPAIFHYSCIRKSYPNRQSDADHSKLNGCQPITQKRSKFSNHLNFKQVYSFCRITEIPVRKRHRPEIFRPMTLIIC